MERRFLTNKDLIKSKAKGESIYITDSAQEKLNNLIIYGKTTQAAEPTLEAPQELVSVGAEPFNVYVTGNNLFKPYAISAINMVYGSPSFSKAYLKNDFGVRINSTTYDNEVGIIAIQEDTKQDNVTPVVDITKGFFCIYFDLAPTYFHFDEKYTFIADVEVLENKHPEQSMRINFSCGGKNNFFDLTSTKQRFCFCFTAKQNPSWVYRRSFEFHVYGKSLSLKNIMWLPGDWTANPPEYEDYKEQVITIGAKTISGTASNNAGIFAIPVDNGGNYTDASGQSWIADTIDLKNGKYYKRLIGRSIPTSNWEVSETQWSEDSGKYVTYQHDTEWEHIGSQTVISNYFPNKIEPKTGEGIWLGKTDEGYARIYITSSITTSEQDFMNSLIENDPDMYYARDVAYGMNLSYEETSAFESLKTNYPITRVISDEDAGMEVEYVADTKNYIDNKIAELTALTLEG